MDSVIKDERKSPTFERGNQESKVDLTIVSQSLMDVVTFSRVEEGEPHSCHKYVVYIIEDKIVNKKGNWTEYSVIGSS